MLMRNSEHRKELISEIRSLAQSQGLNTVFTTFLEITANSLAAQTDPENAEKREQRYQEMASTMTPELLSSYARMLALLFLTVREYRDDPCDILGGIYHELNLNNEWNGQYFTPDDICRFMAQITLPSDELSVKDGPITINEPTCGSGTMVIGAIWAMQRKKFDYRHNTFFVAQDIDIRCVWMTYIQLSLYEIPAMVIHGNTLTMEEWDRWYTPYALVPFSTMWSEKDVLWNLRMDNTDAHKTKYKEERLYMSTNQNLMQHMRELIDRIKAADVAYYRDDNPTMTDREYDLLVDELKELETTTGLILSGSPTQTVSGEILKELTPVRHTKPMLSADKTKSVDEMLRFANGRPVVLSWKLDGLTLVLRYEGGEFKQAITRGREGIIGEDVTHTVRTFMNVPMCIPCADKFEVRGEGVISWAHFEKINLSLSEPYSHPRNLAAGSVRMLDARESGKRYLEFFAFDLISDSIEEQSKTAQLQFLAENGFDVVPYVYTDTHDADELRELIADFKPAEYGYPVDGVIMEYDNLVYGRSLGATGHHENRLMALKWEDELYETECTGLDVAVTRTGMVSLTATFKPVEIDGTMVSRAYVHNFTIYKNLALGIGDKLMVYKANKIIPQIAENRTKSGELDYPHTCPCCGSRLTFHTLPGGSKQLFCENPSCAAKLVQKFDHFCEKTRMNIEGLSATTLEKFIGHGWIKNFGDLYALEQHREDIIQTEGFGVKSYERLQESIEKSRHCTLAKFIAGLGIPMVGRHAGRDLDRYFGGSWEAFESAIQSGFDFTQLPNFGETMHNNIYKWYADEEEAKLWRPLLDKIIFEKETTNMSTNTSNPFYGKTVVATGKLENYTRDGIQMRLLELGAKPGSSVSKNTDYLIVGEKAGSKLAKAQQLGVKTLTEQEFENMLAE